MFQSYVYFTLQIDSVFETYDTFFNLHVQVKEKYAKKEGTSPNGWDAIERERWVNIRLSINQSINSLLSKCFRLVSEQKETVEGEFRF